MVRKVCARRSFEVPHAPRFKWPINRLTYFINQPDRWDEIREPEVSAAFDFAFKSWEAVCNIHFTRTNNPQQAHIWIGHRGIDRKFGTLAWSELADQTTRQKEQRYDKFEDWKFEANPGGDFIDLGAVGAHEIGHVIGIDHHNEANSLMNPTYNPRIRIPQPADIRRAVQRYGEPQNPPNPPDNPPSGPIEFPVYIIEGTIEVKFTATPQKA